MKRWKRPDRIHVTYLDEELKEHDEWVEGYLARVMQHEFDHLDGKCSLIICLHYANR